MAATFVNVSRGTAVRVVARDDARARVPAWAPGEADPRRAQIAAHRIMPEPEMLRIERVMVTPGWLDRPRVRVPCDGCGEDVNYRRETVVNARVLCRPCAGEGSYRAS
jgi:formylmethanofuran dehydrogenase subunit E